MSTHSTFKYNFKHDVFKAETHVLNDSEHFYRSYNYNSYMTCSRARHRKKVESVRRVGTSIFRRDAPTSASDFLDVWN